MTVSVPIRMQITLPRSSNRDLVRLYNSIEKIGDNTFTRRLRLLIGDESKRRQHNQRATETRIEPAMVVLAIDSGNELAEALHGVMELQRVKLGSCQAFVDDLQRHVIAMAAGVCQFYDADLRGLFGPTRRNSQQFELLRPSEVAVMLGVSESSLTAMVKAKSFPPPLLVGRKRFWKSIDVDNYLQNLGQ